MPRSTKLFPLAAIPRRAAGGRKGLASLGFVHLLPSRNCLPFHGSWSLTKINNFLPKCLSKMIMIMAGEKKNHQNAGLKADKGLTLLFMHLIIYKNYLHLLSATGLT